MINILLLETACTGYSYPSAVTADQIFQAGNTGDDIERGMMPTQQILKWRRMMHVISQLLLLTMGLHNYYDYVN